MKASNLVLGIIGGIAAGAVLGILFAPDKGCNTRKKIAEKGNDLKDNMKDKFNDFLSTVEDKYSDIASMASNKIDDATDNIEKINKELKR